MSEIPEDVMRAVREGYIARNDVRCAAILDNIRNGLSDGIGALSLSDAAILIAAERERCARIALHYECSLADYGESPSAKPFYESGVIDATMGIAAAIRNPEPPKETER